MTHGIHLSTHGDYKVTWRLVILSFSDLSILALHLLDPSWCSLSPSPPLPHRAHLTAGTTFLDHALVVLVLEEQRRPAGQQLCNPESVQTDLSLTSEIEGIWRAAMDQDVGIVDQCVAGLGSISHFLHEQARSHLEASREREIRLWRGLRSLQRLQEMRPFDSELEEQMAVAR